MEKIIWYIILLLVGLFYVILIWAIDDKPKNPYKGENTFPDDY